jgi:uncharacterized protein (DUF2141 family)
MKSIYLTLLSFILISNISFSQFKLDIEITEIKNNTGKLMFQLFDENEQIIKQEIGIINDKKCSFSIGNLKAGKYAVRYFHDENLNGDMEKNLVGKPTEGYGFSNNVVGKYSMPPFEKWLFELSGDKKLILKPTY